MYKSIIIHNETMSAFYKCILYQAAMLLLWYLQTISKLCFCKNKKQVFSWV